MNSGINATIRRKNLKKVNQFIMMIVGKSGLGKSTFVNTLFNDNTICPVNNNYEDNLNIDINDLTKPIDVKFVTYNIDREEFGNKLSVTVVDTPGFGESLQNESGCHAILRYIEEQYDHFLSEEIRIKRNPKFQDTRIHALLYFISPNGHSLKELDILFMKIVGKRVNVIPVIAKADALSPEELLSFKKNIREVIEKYNIPILNFPMDVDEEDSELIDENEELKSMIPFTIIGADYESSISSEKNLEKRGRKYPWGFVDIENPNYCDFVKLKDVLLNTHFQELKDITQNVLYENYRTEKLSQKQPSVKFDQKVTEIKSTENNKIPALDSKKAHDPVIIKNAPAMSESKSAFKSPESKASPTDSAFSDFPNDLSSLESLKLSGDASLYNKGSQKNLLFGKDNDSSVREEIDRKIRLRKNKEDVATNVTEISQLSNRSSSISK